MKVLMIGTPMCVKCKKIAPKIEEYCKEHNIEYEYSHLNNADPEVVDMLLSKNVVSAPAFLVYRGEDITIISGDDIFVKLESL